MTPAGQEAHRAHEAIVGPPSGTPEWFETRRRYVTATKVPMLLGRSEYGTPLHVYRDMVGELEPIEQTAAMRRGTRYEAAILGDYAEQRGVDLIYPMPFLIHPDLLLGATPDAQVVGTPKGVEGKFSMSRTRAEQLGEDGSDWVPEDWLLQTQTQMAVTGWIEVDVAVLLFGRLRIYTVPRNDTLIRIIHEAAEDMIRRVEQRDPPEPTWSHPATPELMKCLRVAEGATIDLSAEAAAEWKAYKAANEIARQAEAKAKMHRAKVEAEMGEAQLGRADGFLVARSIVAESVWSEADVAEAQTKIGTVKRRSYVTLTQRKVK